ncbi:MAG: hypothetical protein PW735_02560 [Acidobacteriaceae bacterium]|nr:hypothetical protein [Acidobacteriaceae bacterium]
MPAYELFAFTEEFFFNALSSKHCSPEFISQHNAIAQYIARYLGAIGTTYMLIEHDYVDADYLDDHSVFYVKCFQHYTNRTKRLHFFAGPVPSNEEFERLVTTAGEDSRHQLQEAYLGFVVARPLPAAVVGRTVLRTYPDDHARRQYPATKNYKVNLFGIRLNVCSLAFQQQDRALAACATVALWSCFHKTSELYSTTSPTPGSITRTASIVVSGRPIPSQGLEFHQMCEAVRAVGLDPEVYKPQYGLPFASLIYSYLKMGQPVILGIHIEGVGAHAITVSGYSMTTTRSLALEAGFGQQQVIPFKGEWINELYVHDDQTGPFARLALNEPEDQPDPNKPKETVKLVCDRWAHPDGTSRDIRAFAVLIPTTSTIRIGFTDIAEFAKKFSALFMANEIAGLVWDIYISESNSYKADIRERPDSEVPSLKNVLFMTHPRYIWVSRLDSPTGMKLEVLHDATNVHGAIAAYVIRWGDANLRTALRERLEQ